MSLPQQLETQPEMETDKPGKRNKRPKRNRKKPKQKMHVFDYINYTILTILTLATIYPFWYVLVISFSTQEGYYQSAYHLLPNSFSLETYKYAFTNDQVFRSIGISLTVTIGGVLISLVLTAMGAYVLSKQKLKGRKAFFIFMIFTMFFNGGIVPLYILVNSLEMRDTVWALILPMAINTFNLILMMNYFSSLPESLEEAAKIDGCNDFQILFKIVLPSSKPIVMTIVLFYAVFYWNDWFLAMLFISNQDYYPLSLFLRNMIISSQNFMSTGLAIQVPEMLKSAVIVISVVPVMLFYPFVQKYFVQGIMLGSVKE
ncbi:carbohydrate ABC transporter permease [Pseudalkalibacillus caeni]|uniref:Carbohydrate ABC transporter permease n=1 Tax=Exobacillus caeni TaxID=2574798 RepID=A0A5R9F787_9BACL|nr:carbohydrate ABC transporter permease [Pseudalkalibacillus caeni]TLS38389.1 carbohydrate ABC transporter permease [Pseudalkalibacillus caeni]